MQVLMYVHKLTPVTATTVVVYIQFLALTTHHRVHRRPQQTLHYLRVCTDAVILH